MDTDLLTRRSALRLLGGTVASATGLWPMPAVRSACTSFHCVALQSGSHGAGLYVLRTGRSELDLVRFEPVPGLSSSAVSRNGRLVFVTTSAPEEDTAAAGALHSYAFSEQGSLRYLSSRSLSSAATCPEAVAFSVCGRRVAVLAGERSVFNVFDVDTEGRIGDLAFVHKDIFLRSAMDPVVERKVVLAFQEDGSLLYSVRSRRTKVRYVLANGTLAPVLRTV